MTKEKSCISDIRNIMKKSNKCIIEVTEKERAKLKQ